MFRIAPSRSLTVLAEQLGIDTDAESLPEGRALLLSSDFYAVYQSLGRMDGVDNLWRWAHYADLCRHGSGRPSFSLVSKAAESD